MKERDYDLDAELDWMEDAEGISDGFDHIYQEYTKKQEARRWKPAWAGRAVWEAPEQENAAYVPGFIYAGCIAAVVGPPKAGKSTFLWSMLDKLMAGQDFLGQKTQIPGSVLYISEQSRVSFKGQLKRLPEGMGERVMTNSKFFLMLPEHHVTPLGIGDAEAAVVEWQGRLELWKKAIAATKADVVVIDTFGAFADLGQQGENDNAIVSKRFTELRQLQKAKPSLAIVLICHTTKASSKKRYLSLQDIRGASALAGALDHGITFQKQQSRELGKTSIRFINCESRMLEERRDAVAWTPDGSFVSLSGMTVREIAEDLDISKRKAHAIYKSLHDDENDQNPDDESGTEADIPIITPIE